MGINRRIGTEYLTNVFCGNNFNGFAFGKNFTIFQHDDAGTILRCYIQIMDSDQAGNIFFNAHSGDQVQDIHLLGDIQISSGFVHQDDLRFLC